MINTNKLSDERSDYLMFMSKSVKTGEVLIKDGICHMCTSGCSTKVHVQQGKILQIDMMDQSVMDTCPRWKAQLDFVYHAERLRHPLKRVGERGTESFERVSWDEALDTVATNFLEIKDDYGAESVIFYISYPKEPRPYFQRLAHAFGSPNYCTESSNCFTATKVAAALNFGIDYNYIASQSRSLDPKTRCELSWSSSVRNSSPNMWKAYLEGGKRGVKHIVVDPRRTGIASMADIHLQLRPGTDGALALGLLNVIIERKLYDEEFVGNWTSGFDGLKNLVQEYPLNEVEEITRVPAAKVEEAAIMFASNKPAKIRMSPGSTTHHYNGVQNHRAILLLAALTGNLDVAGGNIGDASYIETNDITLYERVASLPPGIGSDRFPIWTEINEEMQANIIPDRIESGDPYPIKALFAAGLNLMFFPNYDRLVEKLSELDMIVNLDFFHTPASKLADVILPIASWLERPILVNKRGGFVQFIEPAIDPVGECWTEWKIYAELAKRLGFGEMFWDGDFDKCINYILEPSGITVNELRKHPEGIRFPVPVRPEKCYEKVGFQTPSGKVEISSSVLTRHGYEALPVYKEPLESPISRPDLTSSFPLVLTTGARNVLFTHSQFRNIKRLCSGYPEPLIEIHPADAQPRGIESGNTVLVSSPRGSIKIKADVKDSILPGVVHIPHHWPGEANVNILASDQTLDPISGFASFKSQLCQVTLLH